MNCCIWKVPFSNLFMSIMQQTTQILETWWCTFCVIISMKETPHCSKTWSQISQQQQVCNAKVKLLGIRMPWELCQTQGNKTRAPQNRSSTNNFSQCSLRRKKSLIRLLVLKHTISGLDVEVALQKWARGWKLLLGLRCQFCGPWGSHVYVRIHSFVIPTPHKKQTLL